MGLVLQHQVLKEDLGKEKGDHPILLRRGVDLMQYLLPQVPGEDWGEKGTIPSSPIRVALNQSNQSLWYSTYCTMFLERTEGEGMGDHPILLKGSYSDIVLTGPGSRRGLRRERRGTIQSSSKGVTHVGLAVRGSYVPHGSGLSPISFFFVH